MFTGVNFEKAFDYWKKGCEVIVIDRNSKTEDGGYDTFSFAELFQNVELLADVPAVINPDFEQAVIGMMNGSKDDQKDELEIPLSHEKPKEVVVLPAEKSKREIIEELVHQGFTNKEIEEKTGIPYGTIGYYRNLIRKKKEAIEGNEDRHLCKSCQYRGEGGKNGCDYAYITGKARGCKVEECGRYVKGSRLKAPKGL